MKQVGDEESTGKEIAKALNRIESDFQVQLLIQRECCDCSQLFGVTQNNMEEMYVNMHRTTFKAMRRFLPISRQVRSICCFARELSSPSFLNHSR